MTSTATIHLSDCVTGMAEHLAPESVDLCVTSIPFGALFMYSGKNEDIGNNQDGTDMRASMFGLHMRFFIDQLQRVMKPGTNACIHIQQLLRYKNQHGSMGRRDFRGAVVDLFESGRLRVEGRVRYPEEPADHRQAAEPALPDVRDGQAQRPRPRAGGERLRDDLPEARRSNAGPSALRPHKESQGMGDAGRMDP
jgi:hypothetical protein